MIHEGATDGNSGNKRDASIFLVRVKNISFYQALLYFV